MMSPRSTTDHALAGNWKQGIYMCRSHIDVTFQNQLKPASLNEARIHGSQGLADRVEKLSQGPDELDKP